MGKGSSAPPPPDPNVVAAKNQQINLQTGQQNQALSTIGQDNPYGSLSYTTTIDPITGLPKYQANSSYSPEQQAILDFLQSNQLFLGGAGQNLLTSNMGQYGQPIDLSMAADSNTRAALDPMMANLNRYMQPQLEQRRTQLINQGIPEGSKLFDLEMNKVRDQQGSTMGAQIASFYPSALKGAEDQQTLPLSLMQSIFGMTQPAGLPGQLVNTPGANIGGTDYGQIANQGYQNQLAYNAQKNAANNAFMSMILGTGTKLLATPL